MRLALADTMLRTDAWAVGRSSRIMSNLWGCGESGFRDSVSLLLSLVCFLLVIVISYSLLSFSLSLSLLLSLYLFLSLPLFFLLVLIHSFVISFTLSVCMSFFL